MRKFSFNSLISVIVLMSSYQKNALTKELYDGLRSEVAIYTNLNFEKQVSKNRDKGISIVHFYKDEGKYSSNFNTTNF